MQSLRYEGGKPWIAAKCVINLSIALMVAIVLFAVKYIVYPATPNMTAEIETAERYKRSIGLCRNLLCKRKVFALMLGELLSFAREHGYEVTIGDVYAQCGHAVDSLHKLGLAVDLNLFKGNKYLTNTEDHVILGEFWESIGGSWGGRFGDGNHYSIEHNGKR